ncbi:hypothetical protein JKP88DRAFT_245145 [Tribonema minus]|uniref:Uncharacterized protein n=1 Tax=Tribonema minus TaxID=303371 RepID=A0A835Z5B0_9STRA|nr:hypothetical protein JKP88DRAFT_255813 [Tribonema minus]KAG5183505.1 hypothetical protein JKP88DRAFT_245145 [Tribonema minus]
MVVAIAFFRCAPLMLVLLLLLLLCCYCYHSAAVSAMSPASFQLAPFGKVCVPRRCAAFVPAPLALGLLWFCVSLCHAISDSTIQNTLQTTYTVSLQQQYMDNWTTTAISYPFPKHKIYTYGSYDCEAQCSGLPATITNRFHASPFGGIAIQVFKGDPNIGVNHPRSELRLEDSAAAHISGTTPYILSFAALFDSTNPFFAEFFQIWSIDLVGPVLQLEVRNGNVGVRYFRDGGLWPVIFTNGAFSGYPKNTPIRFDISFQGGNIIVYQDGQPKWQGIVPWSSTATGRFQYGIYNNAGGKTEPSPGDELIGFHYFGIYKAPHSLSHCKADHQAHGRTYYRSFNHTKAYHCEADLQTHHCQANCQAHGQTYYRSFNHTEAYHCEADLETHHCQANCQANTSFDYLKAYK